jgi:tetratricopeptide (TPR) repeat protein
MSQPDNHTFVKAIANRILLTCSFLIFVICNSNSQTAVIDSLKKILPSLNGKQRIECLNELGFEYSNPYWSRSKHIVTDTARYYTEMALRESHVINYEPGIGKAYQNLGMIEEEYGQFSRSEFYTKLAISVLSKYDRRAELHRALINLGFCYYNQGCYMEARNIYEHELKYYYAVNDMVHVPMIYRMIAHSYESEGQIRNAFEAYLKDFEIAKRSDDIINALYSPSNKAKLYLAAGDTANAIINYRLSAENKASRHLRPEHYFSRIAKVYRLQKKEDSAINYLHTNIGIINRFYTDTNARRRAFAMNAVELADLLSLQHKFDSSLYFAHYARKVFEDGNDMGNWMMVTGIIAGAYLELDDVRSLYYAQKLKEKAETLKAPFAMLNSYDLLWKYYSKKGLYQSKEYEERYKTLRTSVSNDVYASRIATVDLLARMKLREDSITSQFRLNQVLEEEKIRRMAKENKLLKIIFLLVATIVSLIIGIAVRNSRNKKRKEQWLQQMKETGLLLEKQQIEQELSNLQLQKAELEMKALKAQMNPHFISNSLNAINLFILQNNKEQASIYLTKFARLIRTILRYSEASLIELKREIETIEIYMELEKLRFDDHFEFSISVDTGIDLVKTRVPPLLLQPYIENAIWHGLMQKDEKGLLDVHIYKEDSMLVYAIRDDGVGRENALKLTHDPMKESMGIRLTSERIALMKTKGHGVPQVTINDLVHANHSPAGTEVIIKIPLSDV